MVTALGYRATRSPPCARIKSWADERSATPKIIRVEGESKRPEICRQCSGHRYVPEGRMGYFRIVVGLKNVRISGEMPVTCITRSASQRTCTRNTACTSGTSPLRAQGSRGGRHRRDQLRGSFAVPQSGQASGHGSSPTTRLPAAGTLQRGGARPASPAPSSRPRSPGMYPSLSHHFTSSAGGLGSNQSASDTTMYPPFFRNGFQGREPFSKPTMKIAPSDQMRSNCPCSNGRASIEAQTVLIRPAMPPLSAHASMVSRNGWWLSTAVMVPSDETGKVPGLGSFPAPDIEDFCLRGERGRYENAFLVAPGHPGPCRGRDSNTW